MVLDSYLDQSDLLMEIGFWHGFLWKVVSSVLEIFRVEYIYIYIYIYIYLCLPKPSDFRRGFLDILGGVSEKFPCARFHSKE